MAGIPTARLSFFHFFGLIVPGYFFTISLLILFGQYIFSFIDSLELPSGPVRDFLMYPLLILVSGPIMGYFLLTISQRLFLRRLYHSSEIDILKTDELDLEAPPHIFQDIMDLVGMQVFALNTAVAFLIIAILTPIHSVVSKNYSILWLAPCFAILSFLFYDGAKMLTYRICDKYRAIKSWKRKHFSNRS